MGPTANGALRIPAGSACSANDDRAEAPPVRFAGVEQDSDPVVLEVAEAEADALDPLDQVVERFGRTVAHAGQMEGGDLVEPVPNRAPEALDLRWHGLLEAVPLELGEHRFGLVGIARSVEVTQALLDPVGNGHLGSGIAQLEERGQAF